MDTWPLERHRIALITVPDERPLPKTWIWLCQPCVKRLRSGEPLGAAPTTAGSPRGRLPMTDGLSLLTTREREIAMLIAQGLTNREIARRLVVVPGTVANHVAHIMRRLGARTRVDVAVWSVQAGLVSQDGHDGASTPAVDGHEPDREPSPRCAAGADGAEGLLGSSNGRA
jgi:DNA-binding CsgD family transcriptional regulator